MATWFKFKVDLSRWGFVLNYTVRACPVPRNVNRSSEGSAYHRDIPPLDTRHITMSQPSLAPFIRSRPWLKRWMVPFANWYASVGGYRKLGLK